MPQRLHHRAPSTRLGASRGRCQALLREKRLSEPQRVALRAGSRAVRGRSGRDRTRDRGWPPAPELRGRARLGLRDGSAGDGRGSRPPVAENRPCPAATSRRTAPTSTTASPPRSSRPSRPAPATGGCPGTTTAARSPARRMSLRIAVSRHQRPGALGRRPGRRLRQRHLGHLSPVAGSAPRFAKARRHHGRALEADGHRRATMHETVDDEREDRPRFFARGYYRLQRRQVDGYDARPAASARDRAHRACRCLFRRARHPDHLPAASDAYYRPRPRHGLHAALRRFLDAAAYYGTLPARSRSRHRRKAPSRSRPHRALRFGRHTRSTRSSPN